MSSEAQKMTVIRRHLSQILPVGELKTVPGPLLTAR